MNEFSFKITMNIGIPKISDANIPLEQIAVRMREDARLSLRKQKSPASLGGGRFRPLAEETIRKKKAKKYANPNKALRAKDVMYHSIMHRKKAKNSYYVTVLGKGNPRRDLVAKIHQEIGVPSKRGRVIRPFMGISKQTRKFAIGRMKRWIRKKLKETPPKYIKIELT